MEYLLLLGLPINLAGTVKTLMFLLNKVAKLILSDMLVLEYCNMVSKKPTKWPEKLMNQSHHSIEKRGEHEDIPDCRLGKNIFCSFEEVK